MSEPPCRYLFGPVPSRRLGRSLGVDLTPFKTCSFDCIFCQLGRTTRRTMERREYVPVDAVVAKLREWLAAGGTADVITLAGSGEPTLNSRFGRVIEAAREATTIPVALLTNGSLLADPDVRAQAAAASVVKVSLSAWDQASLERINRPDPGLPFDRLLEGLRLFRRQFKGELWMEVFLAWGTNATPEDVARIAALARTVAPDRVQLNTAVRPPCEAYVQAVPEERLRALADLFDPAAEVIAEFGAESPPKVLATEAGVLAMLQRRPCTLEQICQVSGLHRNEASKYVGRLLRTGRIVQQRTGGEPYYAGVRAKDP